MRISILIPVYNVEKYIRRCIESIFQQTYQDLEYIFVDDATPDKSISIIQESLLDYPNRAPYVKIISHSHNRGVAAARNTGLEAATGDYFYFIDPDDYIETNTISIMADEAKKSNADIIFGNILVHDKNSTKAIIHHPFNQKKDAIISMIGLNQSHHLVNNLIRLSLIKKHHIKAIEGVNYGEDHLIMVQVVYYASIISNIEECTYHYDCSNSNSYVQTFHTSISDDKVTQIIKAIKAILDFFKDKEPIYYEYAKSTEFHYFYWVLSQLCRQGKRKKYEEIAKLFITTEPRYWTLRDWFKPLFRNIVSSYCLMRIYLLFK